MTHTEPCQARLLERLLTASGARRTSSVTHRLRHVLASIQGLGSMSSMAKLLVFFIPSVRRGLLNEKHWTAARQTPVLLKTVMVGPSYLRRLCQCSSASWRVSCPNSLLSDTTLRSNCHEPPKTKGQTSTRCR